ncbi:uncharacterized protein LOC111828755 [Capsella rubella]|uniref:uncharacterized protein LOC111828755 n=1 Tax=Capsella rubella TaxID=81985 RepID=UPI000CD57BD8|nr:uncharacterized protein LOC111828755 [Capsella rubella]XP_023633253.1 uncharacterized protein LOC111828755 [Capsella rubella]XP_023633254.1 uncharacterized protein LOC111828755 [Capsella rubella]
MKSLELVIAHFLFSLDFSLLHNCIVFTFFFTTIVFTFCFTTIVFTFYSHNLYAISLQHHLIFITLVHNEKKNIFTTRIYSSLSYFIRFLFLHSTFTTKVLTKKFYQTTKLLFTSFFVIYKMASSSHDEFSQLLNEEFDNLFQEEFDNQFQEEFDNSLEEHQQPRKPRKKRVHIERHREEGHIRLWNDYFGDYATFPPNLFRRRFRMNKNLFMRIVDRLTNEIPFFPQRRDATGRLGFSPLQKCTAAIRMLAYGCAADAVDEYLRIGETTSMKCMQHFLDGIIYCFGDEYLRKPTAEDLQRLLIIGEIRGFPGMMGSIDCMHWEWKNCPTAWKGQYTRASGKPTIVLEAVASQDLWIWHAFFGPPGTLNDINILDRSPVFDDILQGRAPKCKYVVNGNEYSLGYYLTDGIYPKWATFIQSIPLPQGDKPSLFAEKQEACRKDVERAFGVLQARFAIIKNPALIWDKERIASIMRACIILHNMIVEDERDMYTQFNVSEFQQAETEGSTRVDFSYDTYMPSNIVDLMAARTRLRDRTKHEQLKNDLVEHIWSKFSSNQV